MGVAIEKIFPKNIIDNIRNAEVIIFDLDGTIIKLDVDWKALKRELHEYFISTYGVSINFTPLSHGLYEVRKLGSEASNKAYGIIEKYETKKIDSAKPIQPMIELAKTLSPKKKLAIFSSNTRETVVSALKKIGLYGTFELIVGLEDANRPKPNPEALFLILNYFGVPRSKAIFIGDDEVDLEAGRKSGVRTLVLSQFYLK